MVQKHIGAHTEKKPFSCYLCSRAFADKNTLRAHEQTHSSDKPFVCGGRGKTFALKSYLCKHEGITSQKQNTEPAQKVITENNTLAAKHKLKKKSEELVSVENTARNTSKTKKNVEKNKEAVNPAEMVLGCMVATFSHRRSARIKKLILRKWLEMANNLGVEPFPDQKSKNLFSES